MTEGSTVRLWALAGVSRKLASRRGAAVRDVLCNIQAGPKCVEGTSWDVVGKTFAYASVVAGALVLTSGF
jgi:hypothetical protein